MKSEEDFPFSVPKKELEPKKLFEDVLTKNQEYVVERIKHERVIEAPTTRQVLDRKTFDTLVGVTPNVMNKEYWLSHVGATTVTNFLDGQDGQHLYIYGNGNTELTHGTNIFLVGGVNLTLAADRIYHLIHYNTKWYQVGE